MFYKSAQQLKDLGVPERIAHGEQARIGGTAPVQCRSGGKLYNWLLKTTASYTTR
jgi:hypothetical protein